MSVPCTFAWDVAHAETSPDSDTHSQPAALPSDEPPITTSACVFGLISAGRVPSLRVWPAPTVTLTTLTLTTPDVAA